MLVVMEYHFILLTVTYIWIECYEYSGLGEYSAITDIVVPLIYTDKDGRDWAKVVAQGCDGRVAIYYNTTNLIPNEVHFIFCSYMCD